MYVAVALTTLATLLLELSLTRIFSVVFYYHFAFLAISIALFGLGAGGVFSYVAAGWTGPLFSRLGRLSAINSLLVLVALATVLDQTGNAEGWSLVLVYCATSLPFFVSGMIVSLAISENMERVNRVYFSDLAGAVGGCLLLVPLLDHLGGPNTVIAVGVLFAAAAAVWHSLAGSVTERVVSVALALGLVGLVFLNSTTRFLDVRYAKGLKLAKESFVKWNSFSRIAIAPERGSGIPLIYIDADASTGIANFDFDHLSERERHDLLEQGPGLPYVLRPGAKTLVIGPGGGWDVARALASGSHDITGVEINPIIARTIMQQRYPEMSRNLYLRPDVRILVEDGRSFARRSAEKYQVIQATLVDTWASTAAGAFALSENNLYTTDAFRDYLTHLTDDGILAFTRWGFDPPRESLRLVSLAIEALGRLGEREPWRHIIVGRAGTVEGWGASDTVLISRKPFSSDDLEGAKRALAAAGMASLYLPGDTGSSRPGREFAELLRHPDPREYQQNYPFDISPVSDNRPFFFYTVQPRDLWAFLSRASHQTADYKINKAVPLLFGVMAVSVGAMLVMLLLPPLVLGARLPRQRGVRGFLIFFICIGAGYILIEVALIQKFVLFLGHPTYALWVVIFAMLLSSGLGSYASGRVARCDDGELIKILGLVAIAAAVLALAVSSLLSILVWLPLWLKIAFTIALIAPAGFIMGMPFPVALEQLERWHKPSLRWAWSLNAAASVLGSVLALISAIYLGLMQTLLLGGALYLAALGVVLRGRSDRAAPSFSVSGLAKPEAFPTVH